MGKHFGELAKYRNIIQFRLSPHEQRAFAGAISQGIPNIFRRFKSEGLYVAVRKFFQLFLFIYLFSLITPHYFHLGHESHCRILRRNVLLLVTSVSLFFPALLISYMVYDQTEKKHKQLQRKNLADFEHEK